MGGEFIFCAGDVFVFSNSLSLSPPLPPPNSAKNDINVEQSFISIARAVKDRLIADGVGGPSKGGGTFQPKDVKKGNGGCCK